MPQAKHHGNHQKGIGRPGGAGKLQQASQCGKDQAQTETQVGHKNRQAGEDANRQGQVKPEHGQARTVENRQQQHHQQLPAQVLAEHGVGLLGEAVHARAQPRRHKLQGPGDKAVPVHQKIKQGYRHQHGIADQCKGKTAAKLDRGQQRGQGVFVVAVEVVQQIGLDACHVQGKANANLGQGWLERAVDALQQHRHLLAQQRQLFADDGHDQQNHAQQGHNEQHLDQHHGQQPGQPAAADPVKPIDQRRERIGQHCSHHKGGEHRRQQPQRQHQCQQDAGPGGGAFLCLGESHRAGWGEGRLG